VTDVDREAAATLLQRACGDGRLTLEEFSQRVGAAWAADTRPELDQALAGVAPAPVVGSASTRDRVVTLFGQEQLSGRWRMPRSLRMLTAFGETTIDLREAILAADALSEGVVEIRGRCLFGQTNIVVPEGVEVDVRGWVVFGTRSLKLAPVPRVSGTPVIVVHVNVAFGEVKVRSRPIPASAFSRAIGDQ
jgi:hypothetical protein